jgi:hypothetical protein
VYRCNSVSLRRRKKIQRKEIQQSLELEDVATEVKHSCLLVDLPTNSDKYEILWRRLSMVGKLVYSAFENEVFVDLVA